MYPCRPMPCIDVQLLVKSAITIPPIITFRHSYISANEGKNSRRESGPRDRIMEVQLTSVYIALDCSCNKEKDWTRAVV